VIVDAEPNDAVVSLVRVTAVAREQLPEFLGTFEDFFDRYADEMVSLSRLITGSVELAEEVVQDSFAIMYQRWDTVRDPLSYARSTVVNRSRSQVRRMIVGREKLRSLPPIGDLPAPDEPDLMLRQALASLTDRQRAAVVLRYWADMSETQIAAELGCRNGTVKSLLARSLQHLRKVVDS
jgi:RNA polymerase sigma-70 factor (sigma-E family)